MEGTPRGDSELISKSLLVEHKLFYFDLKQNPRGRYLKISEKSTGSRSTVIVPIRGIIWFAEIFDYYANGDGGEVPLESKELQLDNKAFYFDVGENPRGRFLKVSEASLNRNRSSIIVPAVDGAGEGWAAFRNVIFEILESLQSLPPAEESFDLQQSDDHIDELSESVKGMGFLPTGVVQGGVSSGNTAADNHAESGGMAPTRLVRAGQKKFFFDMGSNARGQYLRISEVAGLDRSAIILPASAVEQFYETLGEFVEVFRKQGSSSEPGLPTMRTVAPLHHNM